jgi:hypothetical protein
MNFVELNKNDPRIARFVSGYRGRKPIRVSVKASHHTSDFWDGGSRDYTSYIDLNTGEHLDSTQAGFKRQTQNNPFNLACGEVELRPGLLVLVNSVFMGKPVAPRLYVCQEDFDRFK